MSLCLYWSQGKGKSCQLVVVSRHFSPCRYHIPYFSGYPFPYASEPREGEKGKGDVRGKHGINHSKIIFAVVISFHCP